MSLDVSIGIIDFYMLLDISIISICLFVLLDENVFAVTLIIGATSSSRLMYAHVLLEFLALFRVK